MRYLLLVVTVCLSACVSPLSWFSKAKAVVTTPKASIHQSGDVAVPAQTTVTTTKTEAPIPPGSRITIETPPTASNVAIPTLVTSTITERATGPTSFTPSAPPTAVQLADANAKLWFWIGLCIGVAAALFGLVRDWNLVMYGGLAVAGACAFAIYVQQSPWVFAVIGAGVALKVAGPYIWHTSVKSTQTTTTSSTVPPK